MWGPCPSLAIAIKSASNSVTGGALGLESIRIQTFTEKINLSNSTNTDPQNVRIAAEGDKVIMTWWERNATGNEPVLRISSDNGETFGPIFKLAANRTISQSGQ